MQAAAPTETRTSDQGTTFWPEQIRSFLLAALQHDTVLDATHELIFEHVVGGKYHPSVVTENLRPIIDEVLGAATLDDWVSVTEVLTAQARAELGEDAR